MRSSPRSGNECPHSIDTTVNLMFVNPLHPDDSDREMSEYANSAIEIAFQLSRRLSEGPPKIPEHDSPILP